MTKHPMTDEARIRNDERNDIAHTFARCLVEQRVHHEGFVIPLSLGISSFVIWASSFLRHWVFRHSSFGLRHSFVIGYFVIRHLDNRPYCNPIPRNLRHRGLAINRTSNLFKMTDEPRRQHTRADYQQATSYRHP